VLNTSLVEIEWMEGDEDEDEDEDEAGNASLLSLLLFVACLSLARLYWLQSSSVSLSSFLRFFVPLFLSLES